MFGILIRVMAASVRIIPATAIVGVLGYLGFDGLRKYFDSKPEKFEDYNLMDEAERNKRKEEEKK
jgi:hypothetical protein